MTVAKTETTIQLERNIWSNTSRMGTFGCFEVTIGWFGSERVDYITYNTEGIWRCYEIKASKADFFSKSRPTFVGHFNYYVMPRELFEQVKSAVPAHVGVYANGSRSVKRAKRQELSVDEQVLKNSLIRSLYRDVEKLYESGNSTVVDTYRRRLRQTQRLVEEYRSAYFNLRRGRGI